MRIPKDVPMLRWWRDWKRSHYNRMRIGGITCVGIKLLFIYMHWHYGFNEHCRVGWPKLRIRKVILCGRKVPLKYYPL